MAFSISIQSDKVNGSFIQIKERHTGGMKARLND
jgi:hypothetical protein